MSAPFSRALVLTAGLGTRLRPLTLARAKAAVPVDGEALARRVIRWIAAQGIVDLVLNLHHQPATITTLVGDGSDLGARVRYSWEFPILGSAGGPRRAVPLLFGDISGGTMLLVNGDTLTDVRLDALAERHARTGALVTMALIPNPWPDRYGGALLDDNEVVTGFTRRGSTIPSFHFIGVQAAEAATFASLTDGVPAESVLDLYPRLMRERPGSIRGFVSNAAFQDIGTAADLLQTSLQLAAADGREGRPRWGREVQVDRSAIVERSLLWDAVRIGAGARITECIVSDGVTIPDGAAFSRCAIVCRGGVETRDDEYVAGDLLVRPL